MPVQVAACASVQGAEVGAFPRHLASPASPSGLGEVTATTGTQNMPWLVLTPQDVPGGWGSLTPRRQTGRGQGPPGQRPLAGWRAPLKLGVPIRAWGDEMPASVRTGQEGCVSERLTQGLAHEPQPLS